MFLAKGPMKERPGSHFKLIFMAGQMMLIQCFPQKGFILLPLFQGLTLKLLMSLLLFFTSITCSRSKPPGRTVLQTGKTRLQGQQRGSSTLVVCHNLQYLTRRLANLEMIVNSVLVYSRDMLKTLVVLKHRNYFDSSKQVLL